MCNYRKTVKIETEDYSYAPRLPNVGETIHGKEFVTNFGGKGANQCVAAAKLGGKTALVARVGDDVWGPKYVHNLNKEQVNTQNIKSTDNTSTGVAQIIVSEKGENQIVIVAGANGKLSVEDVEEAQNSITNAKVLVVQLETSEQVAIRAIQFCRGISILNGAPALSKYNPQLLSLPTIFCVNESEASVFAGMPVNSAKDAETAALKLLSRGCNSVLITLGAQGAIYVDSKNKHFHHISCPEVKCVDSTGAGDAFIGALAYLLAYEKNINIQQAIQKACIIASDSVTRSGTQISFPGPSILCTENYN
ncbi:ribokinase isoform X2 [Leptinotarsa decemlineata]|uniref:ribokinase isoform X2 n=1 Tax=Leptinotarsa decemlineata TaxID=7539 RepID=UPI003D304DB0